MFVCVFDALAKIWLLCQLILLLGPADCRQSFRFRFSPFASSPNLLPLARNPQYQRNLFRFMDKKSSEEEDFMPSSFRFVDKKSPDVKESSFRFVEKKSPDSKGSSFRFVDKKSPESAFRFTDHKRAIPAEWNNGGESGGPAATSDITGDQNQPFRMVDKKDDEVPAESFPVEDSDDERNKRSYVDLQCRGMYDPAIFAQLDSICEDCYNLYRANEVHNLCRAGCFRSTTFRQCLHSLLMDKESEFYQELVEIIG